MPVAPGSIEMNAGDAYIRGHLAAATGTFSGAFTADNISAVKNINLKNGSLTAYYAFGAAGQTDVTFTLPAQDESYIPTIIAPMIMWTLPQNAFNPSYPDESGSSRARVRLFRNGAVIVDKNPIGSYGLFASVFRSGQGTIVSRTFAHKAIFFVDRNADTTQSNTYRFLVNKGSGTTIFGEYFPVTCDVKEDILVEIRKR